MPICLHRWASSCARHPSTNRGLRKSPSTVGMMASSLTLLGNYLPACGRASWAAVKISSISISPPYPFPTTGVLSGFFVALSRIDFLRLRRPCRGQVNSRPPPKRSRRACSWMVTGQCAAMPRLRRYPDVCTGLHSSPAAHSQRGQCWDMPCSLHARAPASKLAYIWHNTTVGWNRSAG